MSHLGLPSDATLKRVKDLRKIPIVEVTMESGLVSIRTVGFLLRNNRSEVAVGLNADEQGKVADVMSIPTRIVKKARMIRKAQQ